MAQGGTKKLRNKILMAYTHHSDAMTSALDAELYEGKYLVS